MHDDEQRIREDERRRIARALERFIREAPRGTFRDLISYLNLQYREAYDEGWLDFSNALAERERHMEELISEVQALRSRSKDEPPTTG